MRRAPLVVNVEDFAPAVRRGWVVGIAPATSWTALNEMSWRSKDLGTTIVMSPLHSSCRRKDFECNALLAEVTLETIWNAQQFRPICLSTPQFLFWQCVP
jgi:hypothetical protein